MKKFILYCLFICTMMAVKAQTVTITDVNFHAALIVNGVDTNSDTLIQTSEALAVTNLNVQSYGITDLTGISSFTNLQTLDCSGNALTSLNLTGLNSLQSLSCNNNAITNLDVSFCTVLSSLSFTGNPIAVFNASGCSLLSTINGYSGFSNSHNFYIATLTNLNLTNCSSLQSLHLGGSNISNSVQITGCIGLTSITLVGNAILTSFAVSNLPNLTYFEAAYNPQLASLTFTNDAALNHLTCNENALTSLNLSGLPSLYFLNCRSNSLTSLNLNGLTTLRYLFCLNNNLSTLDVSGLSSLYQLNCIGNSNLSCIKVADVSAANSNEAWTKDATAVYSTNCDATVQLTVSKAGAGAGSVVSSPVGIDCGSTCISIFPINTMVTLTATPSYGSVFSGWTGAYVGSDSYISVTMDAAKSIIATFGKAKFPLTISNSGGGTVSSTPAGIDCGLTCTANYEFGMNVQLNSIPSSGAIFAGWTGACAGTGPCVVTIDAAKTVTARFTYPLTITKSGTGGGTVTSAPVGINCGSTCTANYDANQMVTLTAVSDATSTFVGWSGAVSSSSGTINVTMDAAKSINAQFNVIKYTLNALISGSHFSEGTWHIGGSIMSNPAGIDCVSTCTAQYTIGTQVSLTATPNPGYAFTGWSGACTGTASPCVLNMNSSRTVVATFTCIIPSTPSSISGSTTVCTGATATYSVSNDPNASSYTWTLPSGWTGTSTTNSITVTTGGIGTLAVKANSVCGSSSASSELVVTVNSLPVDSNENQLNEITADANTIILDHFNTATTGQLYGAMNYVMSMNGMGAAAEFKNNNWIRYNYNANLSSSGTIDFWIYAKAYNIPLANINWNTGATSYPGAGHVFHSRINPAGKIDVSAWPTGSFSSNASIPLNRWTRITITWGNNNNIIYINGVADVVNTSAFSPSANGNYSIYVPYWGTTNEFYMDEFHVSNKKRTLEEINSVIKTLLIDSEMNSVCENTATNIRITNPEAGISYQLYKENQPFGNPQVGASNPLIFNTGNLSETTHFTIKATNPTSSCSRVLSSIQTITVNPLPIVSLSQTDVLCAGALTGSITASVSGGTAPYTYVWSCANPSPTITSILATIGNNPVASGLPAETYTVTVTDANGCSASTTVTLVDLPQLAISQEPTHPTICKVIGGTATVSVSVTGTAPTYQWFAQPPTGTTWTALTNNANYAGVTSATLTITRTTTSVPATGTKYRVAVTNACLPGGLFSANATLLEQTVLSKAATITARSASNGTLSPALTTCQNSSVNLTLAAGSVGNIQWQSSTTSATTGFTNIGSLIMQSALSAVNPLMTLSSGPLTQDTWFRVVAYNGVCNSVNGTALKITVSLPAVAGTITGGDVTVCGYIATGAPLDTSGTPLALPVTNSTVLILNGNTGIVTWQRSINVLTSATPTWSTVTIGVVGNQLTATNLTADTWYRVLVKNGACSTTSAVTKITVNKAAKAGSTTATTNSVVTTSVCTGGAITFTSAAYTGSAIQWEVSTTSTTLGFAPVLGATGSVFTMTNVPYAPLTRFYVRSVVTSGTCTLARSAVKTILVNPLSVAGTIKGGGTLCVGGGATVSVSGNTGTIQWQYSTDGETYFVAPYWKTVSGVLTYFNPSGAIEFSTAASTGIAATYVFTNFFTVDPVYFRARIKSGVCSETYTSSVQYVTAPAAVAGVISPISATVCPGSGTTLTLTGSVGAIQWRKATVSATTGLPGTFANIAYQTGTTLATGNLTATTAYQAVVTIGACSILTTNTVIVTVVAKPITKTITSVATVPAGTLAAPLCTNLPQKVLTIGVGSTGTIQWQTSTTSTTIGFTDIAGANGVSYTVTNPAEGVNYYRASFTNSCGVIAYNSAVTLYYTTCGAREVAIVEEQIVKAPFAVVAYPNPYSENFMIDMATSSQEKTQILVYDSVGKLIEKREIKPSEVATQEIGQNYPSGIYNIIVNQGVEVKVLRVIKRP